MTDKGDRRALRVLAIRTDPEKRERSLSVFAMGLIPLPD
jgi:hypothetical protein